MSSGALPVDTSVDDFIPSKQNKVLAGALRVFTPGCVPSHCHRHTYRSGNHIQTQAGPVKGPPGVSVEA